MSDVNNTPATGAEVAATAVETTAVEKDQAETAAPENEERTAPKGVQKRIDELTQLRRQAERDRDHWRELAMRGQQQAPAQQPAPQVQAPQGKPTLEQHGFDQEKYLEALADWKIEELGRKHRETQQQQQRQTREQEIVSTLTKSLRAANAKYEDFAVRVGADGLPFNATFVETVVEASDDAGDVLYYLACNPEKAHDIAKMSERRAAAAIAKIEAQLAKPATSSAPAVPAAPQVSKAPPPPAAVGNRTTVAVDPMKLSADEWRAQRNKEIAARHAPGRRA